jgi:hypothetical protein
VPRFASRTLLALSIIVAPSVAHPTRCSLAAEATRATISLARGEELGGVSVSVSVPASSEQLVWIAARVLPHRFARRPRTRVLVGALDRTRTQWSVPPVEVASLPGRADLPLALASDSDGATVILARPASALVVRVTTEAGYPVESLALAPPRTASGPPLIDAQGGSLAILWRAPQRLSLATSTARSPLRELARFDHVPRRGSLGLSDLCGLVALSPTSAGAVFCQRSGALSLVSIERGAVARRAVQAAHCPDHCDRVAVTAVPNGAVALFAMKVRRERLLRSHWASRVTLNENTHTQSTIPILRGAPFAAGPGVDAIAQLARPVVLRALERPLALAAIESIPRSFTTTQTGPGEALSVTALDGGQLSIAPVRCERSPGPR